MEQLNPVMGRNDIFITQLIHTVCQKYGPKTIGRGLSALRYPIRSKPSVVLQSEPMASVISIHHEQTH
jgi:hypothetical protein